VKVEWFFPSDFEQGQDRHLSEPSSFHIGASRGRRMAQRLLSTSMGQRKANTLATVVSEELFRGEDAAATCFAETSRSSIWFWSEPYRAAAAYRLLAAFLILKSSIRLPERNCSTSHRGCLPRPAQVSDG
jgi:hypothetical protein